ATSKALTTLTPLIRTPPPPTVSPYTTLFRSTGGRYFFNYQNSSGLPNAWWRLIDPYNNMVFSTSLGTDQGPLNLPAGTYTVLVRSDVHTSELESREFIVFRLRHE